MWGTSLKGVGSVSYNKQGANYKKISRLSYDVIITYDKMFL